MPERPYQIEFGNAIESNYAAGERRQLGVLPTGAGKSEVIAKIPQRIALKADEQMLVLVHREELVEQDADKLRRRNPDLRIEIEQASKRASSSANVVVASVPTIGKLKNPKKKGDQQSLLDEAEPDFCDRLRKFDPDRVRIIVTDEAHHATADSYKTVYRYFGVSKGEPRFDDPSKLHLGVTATPNRADNIGLEGIFNKIVYTKPLIDMIREKWLADLIPFRANTETDISKTKTVAGEFAAGDLGKNINTEERNQIIVDNYRALGNRESGVAFTANIDHTEKLVAQFLANGIVAAGLSSNTANDQRREILRQHASGELPIVVSCGMLNEGWDNPRCVVGLMARPLKSGLLYEQQIGRLLRLFPSPEDMREMISRGAPPRYIKRYAIIIDFVDLSGRHRLNNVSTLLGLPQGFDMKGSAATKELADIEEALKKSKGTAQIEMFKNTRELKSFVEQVDLFSVPVVPPEIKRFSRLSWVGGGTGYYELLLPSEDYTSLRISLNVLGEFEIHRCVKGFRTMMSKQPTLEAALKFGDGLVPPESMVVLRMDASWRSDPPTDKQIKRIGELMPQLRKQYSNFQDFTAAMAARYNKGSLSTMITQEMTKRGMA